MREVPGGLVLLVCVASAGVSHADTYTVTSTSPTGAGSLGAALDQANAIAGPHTINFNIAGTAPHVIATTYPYQLQRQITVDGTSQPGYAGVPLVVLDGSAHNASGFSISAGSTPGSVVRGLTFQNYDGIGIYVANTTNITIESNYIGVDPTGAMDRGGTSAAVMVMDATSVRIGGANASQRNVLSGSGEGVYVMGTCNGLVVQNNYIGTDVTGSVAIGNSIGLRLFNSGGLLVADNVISGNNLGVWFHSGSSGYVQGNYIGLNASGTAAIPNNIGVSAGTPNVFVGGPTGAASERNIISGNSTGIQAEGNSANLRIYSNYIGTNPAGTAAIPNGTGVFLNTGTNGAYVGGPQGRGNVISGNTSTGVSIARTTSGYVFNNRIGTTADGAGALGNGSDGVVVFEASGIDIGTTNPTGDGANTIANNVGHGVRLQNGGHATIWGNSFYNNTGTAIGGDSSLNASATITSAEDLGTTTQVRGTIMATANSTMYFQLFTSPACDTSGSGEGRVSWPVSSTATDASGVGTFLLTLGVDAPGQVVTATVIDTTAGNTSTFSQCRAVCPMLALAPATLPSATPGVAYSQALTGSGGTGAHTVTLVSGTLPSGITLASNTLSGTATAIGNPTLTFRVTDASGCASEHQRTLSIACGAITLTPATLPMASVGNAYSEMLSASGVTPHTFSAFGAVPPWLTVASDGAMSGTPGAAGSWTFSISVTDGVGCNSVQQRTLVAEGPGSDGGVTVDAGVDASGTDGGNGAADAAGPDDPGGGGGCCRASNGDGAAGQAATALLVLAGVWLRRRRRAAR